MKTRFTLLF